MSALTIGFLVRSTAWGDSEKHTVALSSDREGQPFTVLEAMSCGLPVAAVDIPGIQEVVRDGETGILTARTPDALASAMLAFASVSAEERAAWGGRARAKIVEHHDGKKAAEAVAEIAIGA